MNKTVTAAEEWTVEASMSLDRLVIEPGGIVKAPEGKALSLIVNGEAAELASGTYEGDVRLAVSDFFIMPPTGLFRFSGISTPFRSALAVENGAAVPEKSIPELLTGAELSEGHVSGISLRGCDEDLNGVLVDNSSLVIDGLEIKLGGDGGNDFIGKGAGVTVVGSSDVTLNNADIEFAGVTRCAVHAGGKSTVTVNDSRLVNMSPPTTKMRAAWMLGLDGTNRLTQLTDEASISYNRCEMRSNGWGVLSVDGSIKCRMYVKDSLLELVEPPARGYGAFSIGDCWIYFDNSEIKANGYPIMMNTEDGGGAELSNGCRVSGELYGAMIFRDQGGTLNVSDSSISTGRAVFLVKGSNSFINVKNSVLEPKNGVILQLMDNDEPGMHNPCFHVPVGETDQPIEGRDLAHADRAADVFLKLADMTAAGDIFNSTTDLKACCRRFDGDTGVTIHTGALAGVDLNYKEEAHGRTEPDDEIGDEYQGVKNLEVTLERAALTGVISAAKEHRPEGLLTISGDNHHELSNITQTAAPAINNGVIVRVDADSTWTVTGTSHITALYLTEGGAVRAPEGKTLRFTVDGTETELKAGSYSGMLTLSAE